MRRRPGGTVRVLTRCARCGYSPQDYAVRRLVAFLPGRHELVVCRVCDERHPTTPTTLESHAMAIEGGDPIGSQEFAQRFGADAARVRRTAEYFLGADVYARARRPLLEARAIYIADRDKYRERYREAWGSDDTDDDGDFVFVGSVLCERCDEPRDDPDDPLCAQCREDDDE